MEVSPTKSLTKHWRLFDKWLISINLLHAFIVNEKLKTDFFDFLLEADGLH